jgi:hypothetical protein
MFPRYPCQRGLDPACPVGLARLFVDEGWPPSRTAEFFHVSWRTAAKWAQRYRDEGPAAMADRSSARHPSTPEPQHPWSARSCTCLETTPRAGPGDAADVGQPIERVCPKNGVSSVSIVRGSPGPASGRRR